MSPPELTADPQSLPATPWNLSVEREAWNRLQARLRFRVAMWLLGASAVLMGGAAAAWMTGYGLAPEQTTITITSSRGKEQSRTEVRQTQNPLIGLPSLLGVMGIVALTPAVTWAIAPGSKVTLPGGASGEAESTPESPDLRSARRATQQAIAITNPEVIRMIEVTSSAADQPVLDTRLSEAASNE